MFEVKTEVNFSDGGMSPILERQRSENNTTVKSPGGVVVTAGRARKVPPGKRRLVRHTTLAIISLDKEGCEDDSIWPTSEEADTIVSFSDNQIYNDMAANVEPGQTCPFLRSNRVLRSNPQFECSKYASFYFFRPWFGKVQCSEVNH